MLTKKTFSTLNGATRREGVVIPAARVAEHADSRSLMEHAQAQAAELLAQAERQVRQQIRQATEQAQADFWRQADALLQGFQQDREKLEQIWLMQSGQLLREALSRLLDEIPDDRRRAALLKQLLRQRQDDARGTLYCHPAQKDEVESWLQAHAHLDWRLAGDESLASDELKLITPCGVMSLSWRLAAERLMPEAEAISPA
ncbi:MULTISPECIES: type III secretion system stator protein SctL [unclassified Brenneria]|uniref:type III secretion system stator protein SctL n=1 Tax=unclassified Brenneria TaxID=2634434 RepID=UPI0029C21626|nr:MULTISPECIES: type III secretion system stator protein SctL [unclassified Brenneria]MDX5626672.1 type III secretion system stator protein SctL [Brenneria sp. L3-3Z]MDX5693978.1 type III secretion system stator protein SctL [Brenneria sp. L4-2C]MEE3661381.1 type III secretion system stator protein SctL [Brenneria sp. g21c3]